MVLTWRIPPDFRGGVHVFMRVYRILAGSEHAQRNISKAVRSIKKLEEISRNFGGLDPAKTLSRVRRAGCLFGFGVCIDRQPLDTTLPLEVDAQKV